MSRGCRPKSSPAARVRRLRDTRSFSARRPSLASVNPPVGDASAVNDEITGQGRNWALVTRHARPGPWIGARSRRRLLAGTARSTVNRHILVIFSDSSRLDTTVLGKYSTPSTAAEMRHLLSIKLSHDQDVVTARQRAAHLSQLLGFD